MPSTPSRSLWLQTESGERITLQGLCSIGRSKSSAIPVFSENASRRHAVVRVDDDGACSVIDLGSSNGTFVNGQRVSHSTPLHPGDVLEVGSQRFTLHANAVNAAAAAAEPTPPAAPPAAPLVPCWLIIGDTEQTEGGENYDRDHSFKTAINWAQACQRIIQRYHGWLAQEAADQLCAFWPDPAASTAISRSVVDALRELRQVQQRQRLEFRLAVHYGEIGLQATPAQRLGTLSGPPLQFALRMEELAWVLSAPCLLSQAAHAQIGPALAAKELEPCGLDSYEGTHQFYTL